MQHRVSDLFHLQMGKTPSRNQLEYWENGSNKWISISDLSNCSMYTAETKEAITDCAVRETNIRLVPKSTVIMSFKLSIGKTAITSEPVYTNEAIMAFINKGEELVLPEFLYYQLLFKDWGSAGNRAVMGTTLNKASLSQMKIYVPSLQEQRGIVQVLGHIDSQLKRTNESVNKLDDLVKSRFIEMFGDPIENPKGWRRSSLKEVAPAKGDQVPDKGTVWSLGLDAVEAGTGIILRKDIAKADSLKSSNIGFSACHVLYSKLRPYLNKVVLPEEIGVCTTELLPLLPNQSELNRTYLCYLLRSDSFVSFISGHTNGAKMPRADMNILNSFGVPIPPLTLQQEFADFVAQVDKLRFGAC